MKNSLNKIIVMGASAGGLDALKKVLSPLPKKIPVPILIVQHMMSKPNSSMIELLQKKCQMKIQFANNGDCPQSNNVYIAPPDYHLRIDISDCTMMLSQDDAVLYSRPSIDVLFHSVSQLENCAVTAVVLGGNNQDGSAGAKAIQKNGGYIIAQNPKSTEYPTMPQACINEIAVDKILWLDQIGPYLWDKFAKN